MIQKETRNTQHLSFKLFAVFRQASRAHLVEETESHVIVLLLGLLFLLLLLGGRSGGCRGGSSGRGSELARIGEVLLELLGLLEGDVGDGRLLFLLLLLG